MSVIIIILKILGVFLLSLLSILIFLLMLVLLYPVGYSADGLSEGKWKIQGSLYWLFHIISFHFLYDEKGLDIFFKICGIQLKKKEKAYQKEPDFYPGQENENSLDFDQVQQSKKEPGFDDGPDFIEPDEYAATEESYESPLETGWKDINDRQISPVAEKEKKHKFQLKQKYFMFRQKCSMLGQKIFAAIKKTKDIKQQLTDQTNQKAFSYIWKELVYLLKHMRFRRLRTAIDFSAGDPAVTGQVLGVLSVLPVLYQYDVNIYPDFMSDEMYIRGKFWLKGHFRMIHLLISVIRLFIKKECRQLMHKIIK